MAAVDFTTSRWTLSDFWHAASSCIVPMTLISFCVTLPPVSFGVAMTFMWTTLSTPACRMIRPIIGLRMSARTNSARPIECLGGKTSTPRMRSTSGSALSRRA